MLHQVVNGVLDLPGPGRRFPGLLQPLFISPLVEVDEAQLIMETPVPGIVADTQLVGVDLFVQLASCPVVVSSDAGPLVIGNSVDQTESFLCVFPAALNVPGIVEREAEHEVSHGEIWIECNGAFKQRDSL